MRIRARLLMVGFVMFTAIQFYPRLDRHNPPVTGRVPAPPAVEHILRRACYDCHSNETRWPWYSYVAPSSWLVLRDVQRGRSHLNLSTWTTDLPQPFHRLFWNRMLEQMERGEMPPAPYRLLHPSARVSGEEIKLIRRWRNEVHAAAADESDETHGSASAELPRGDAAQSRSRAKVCAMRLESCDAPVPSPANKTD